VTRDKTDENPLNDVSVLVIDDDDTVRDVLETFLEGEGCRVECAVDGVTGLDTFRNGSFDVVLLDLVMPGIGGIEVLEKILAFDPEVSVIIVTAHGTIQSAVEAMKFGAFDYLTKPFRIEDVAASVARASRFRRLQLENRTLKQALKRRYGFESLVGDSAPMRHVYEMIEKVAASDATVLITGASGTGKEVVAKSIHYNSDRAQKPFVPVNCGAIPHELLESELFGHEKGAFTGAINRRTGRFELAQGGTIFLDEVGEMSPQLQVKMLRVLQEREFERVGGTKTLKADVRVIAATNQDLEKAIAERRFREDLYYRLHVITLHLPPLRQRQEDIPLLCAHFSERLCKKKRRPPLLITREVMAILMGYDWPGNVRELENLVERWVVLKEDDRVTPEDLPHRFFDGEPLPRAGRPLSGFLPDGDEETIEFNPLVADFERTLIIHALEKTNGVKAKAAAYLNINRTTLIEKLKRLGLDERNALPVSKK